MELFLPNVETEKDFENIASGEPLFIPEIRVIGRNRETLATARATFLE
jgi:hypothetical protein